MSSHQDPYHYPDQSPVYYEGEQSPTIARQSHSPEPSWIPSLATDDQSGYSQSRQIGNLFDAEGANFPFNHSQTNYSPQGTSFQGSGARSDTMYNDNIHPDLVPLPFYDYPDFDYRQPQLHRSYPLYGPGHDFPVQSYINNAFQMNDLTHTLEVYHPQGIYRPQISQGPPALVYPPSTQLPPQDRGGLVSVYGTIAESARPTTESLKLGEVNTASAELPNTEAGSHSHTSPVAASSSSQIPAAGPSRPHPSSPERKRLLPLSADEDPSTTRKVVPRSNRAWSVHSTSSDSHRRHGGSLVLGRGPLIPQDRYTTSSVSTFSNAEQRSPITFDLENPIEVGIPIVDILNKTGSFNRIRDHTQAFDHMGKKTFTLRVQWPGYKPWCKTIAALNWKKLRSPITRVKLAEDVATAIRDLLQKKRDERYDPDYAEWNIGPSGIQLDQLCLVALRHVSKGSWQPELCLLQPRRH